jgi:hypothetical protein
MEDGGHGSGHLWLWIVTAGGLVYGDHALHLRCMACSFEFEVMMCMYPAGHVMPPDAPHMLNYLEVLLCSFFSSLALAVA